MWSSYNGTYERPGCIFYPRPYPNPIPFPNPPFPNPRPFPPFDHPF